MTEEIKEILDKLKNGFCSALTYEKLLNYITNLQKENQSLKEKLNCKEYFSSTMPENTEFVILTKENYDKQQKDLALENIILKSRNKKAIEYIKQHCDRPGKLLLPKIDFNYNELLNILQGGDE